jgi:hypothetical protein
MLENQPLAGTLAKLNPFSLPPVRQLLYDNRKRTAGSIRLGQRRKWEEQAVMRANEVNASFRRVGTKLSAVLLVLSCCVFAQEFRATITGRVVDPQGATVPKAKITATLLSTGARSETYSAADGHFTLPFLAPGNYRIEILASGFKRYVRENFAVGAGEHLGLEAQLEVGIATESITVTAESTGLETATASTGQVIGSRQVENLPLNGRTPLVLAQLSMGVTPQTDPKFNRPFDNGGPSGFSMGGAPSQTNELLVNGVPDTTRDLRVAYNPPVDAVDEVRVHVFESDAAYGHTGGGTANVILKGGTNEFHGSAYEFNQTSALAATPFFTNAAGRKNPVGRYNQYGFVAGGPVLVPKLFNGRNRLFWFFSLEEINDSFPEPLITSVPTAGERAGDFSGLLAVSPVYQVYDPATAVLQNGRVSRKPFPGNIIPPSRLNTVAKNLLQFYPAANQPGLPDGTFNYFANMTRRDQFNAELGRIDFNASDKHKLFWDFRHNDRTEFRLNRFNNIATGRGLGRVNLGSTLDDVYTFNPSTFMNVRLNWTRFIESTTANGSGYDPTKLGFPSYIAANSTRLQLPLIFFSSQMSWLVTDTDAVTPFDSYQIFADVVKNAGNHSVKAGTDLRLLRESNVGYGFSSGFYGFLPVWTQGPLDTSPVAPMGQDFASFMLGLPTFGFYDINAFRTNQAGYMALFVHDDWRVKPNLTLNLGLRFEHEFPTTERYNRSVNGFNANVPSPIAAAAIAAYAANPNPLLPPSQFRVNGGLTFASASDPAVYHPESKIFSPRFGFAWTPGAANRKTVLRGGFGVFVFPLGTTGVNQPGFSQATSLVATLDGFVTPYATLSDPFPNGIQQPTGSSQGLATFLGKDITFFNPHVRNPYSMRWNFGVQRALGAGTVLEIAYIGNHALRLAAGSTPSNSNNRQLDYIPGQYLSTSPTRDQATINRLNAVVANPFANLIPGTALNGSVISLASLLKTYPQFTNVYVAGDGAGSSYYHSLTVRLEKRLSHGVTFLSNYTYSKLIERIRFLNDFDARPEKRVSGDDRPQRIVVSGSYELPFGTGKRFRTNSSVADRFVSGWVLNTIYTYQVGAPLATWGNVIYYGGGIRNDPRKVDGASFDVTRFNRNPAEQLGSNVRTFPTQFGNLRQDGANNIDLSILKNTRIVERVSLQLRFEAFNSFNHPEFGAANLSPTSSGFGRITSQLNLPRSIQMGARLVW